MIARIRLRLRLPAAPAFPAAALLLAGCLNPSLVRFEKIAKAAADDDYQAAAARIRK